MAIKHCFQCGKLTYVPHHITDVDSNGNALSYDVCKQCGPTFFEPKTEDTKLNLTHITTPEQLLDFIGGASPRQETKPPCPRCNLSIAEFNKDGRFGCPHCYDHFSEKVKNLVFPYHKASCHVGKSPKIDARSSKKEQLKLLRLKMAQAIELEKYEDAAEIKKQLETLNQGPESSSEDR